MDCTRPLNEPPRHTTGASVPTPAPASALIAAQDQASLLRNLTRQIPGAIYQYLVSPGRPPTVPWASEGIRDIYEIELERLQEDASIVAACVHPDDRARVHHTIAESARTLEPWRCEHRVILPTRGLRWLRADAMPERLADGGTLWHGYVSDVTERALEQQELVRLEAAITSSMHGVAIADLDARITYVNKALLDLWGYTDAAQVLGTTAAQYWVDQEAAAGVLATLRETGRWQGEMPARRVDGSVRRFQVSASAFTDAAGVRVGMLASFADITEARRTEEALHLRDQAIQTAITAIAISDPEGRPVYVNPAFVRLFGYESAADVLGRTLTDFVTADASTLSATMQDIFADGAWQGEFIGRRRDGTVLDVMGAANLMRDASGRSTHLMGSFLDITEANRLAGELQQAQKMESVGRLAGGIAHDFNNLLTVMQGGLDLVRQRMGGDLALDAELAQIGHAAASAADLTRQLLAFSRKQVIAPRVLDLNAVVRQVHGMLHRVLGEDVRIELVLADDLGTVRFDPGQVEQILLNLAVNARDAMPDGGRLTIETSNLTLDQAYARTHANVEAGDYVLLVVSDTGVGMSDMTREHAFEPFFTTKGVGQGTGLGLAMIHGAVSQNGGRVEVYSELGHGSSFRICLPRVRDAMASAALTTTTPTTSDDLPRGSERVVLVEDDDSVRALLRRMLERQGYDVRCFPGGEPLLAWLDTPHEPIQLLLTDVIMPGMNGTVIAERVQAVHPDVRVLYASGYTANVIVQHGVLKPGAEFLSKPFTLATLAQTVRALLDRD